MLGLLMFAFTFEIKLPLGDRGQIDQRAVKRVSVPVPSR